MHIFVAHFTAKIAHHGEIRNIYPVINPL